MMKVKSPQTFLSLPSVLDVNFASSSAIDQVLYLISIRIELTNISNDGDGLLASIITHLKQMLTDF
jgi:hypothetical protein